MHVPIRHKLRRELAHALQLLVLPAVAVLLPWSLAFRVLRRIARWPWMYRDEWRAALAGARVMLPIDDEAEWAFRYRLCRLVDHADFWLAGLRGRSFLARHVDGRDALPGLPAAVSVFFHWGAGLWAVRAQHAAGRPVAIVARRFSPASMGAWVAHFYGHLRFKVLVRAAGHPLIYPPGTLARCVEALRAGAWVMAAPDIVPSDARSASPVTAFGRPARFADGVFEIARRAGVPVVVVVSGLDPESGRRDLRVAGPFAADDPELIQKVVDVWEQLIRERSWSFLLWPALHAFFEDGRQAD